MTDRMRFTIRENYDFEAWDILDEQSDQSHDGDNAVEWIATVYDLDNAEIIRLLLEQAGLQMASKRNARG